MLAERLRPARERRVQWLGHMKTDEDVFQFGPSSIMRVSYSSEEMQGSVRSPSLPQAKGGSLNKFPPKTPRSMSESRSVSDAIFMRTPLRGQRSSLTSSPLIRQRWNQQHPPSRLQSEHHQPARQLTRGNSIDRSLLVSGNNGRMLQPHVPGHVPCRRQSSTQSVSRAASLVDDLRAAHRSASYAGTGKQCLAAKVSPDSLGDEIGPGVYLDKEASETYSRQRHSVSQSLQDLQPISPRPVPPPRTASLSLRRRKRLPLPNLNVNAHAASCDGPSPVPSETSSQIEVSVYGTLPRASRKRNEGNFSSSRSTESQSKRQGLLERLSRPILRRRSSSRSSGEKKEKQQPTDPADMKGSYQSVPEDQPLDKDDWIFQFDSLGSSMESQAEASQSVPVTPRMTASPQASATPTPRTMRTNAYVSHV